MRFLARCSGTRSRRRSAAARERRRSRAERRGSPPRLARLPGAVGRELGHRASDAVLDRRIGAARELAFSAVPLAAAAGRSAPPLPGHVTVNDVLLAGVAGGLRDWLGTPASGCRACGRRSRSASTTARRARGRARQPRLLPQRRPADRRARPARAGSTCDQRPDGRAASGTDDAEELYDLFHALARFRAPRSRRRAARGRSARVQPLDLQRARPGMRAQRSAAARSRASTRSPSRPTATRCGSRRSRAQARSGSASAPTPTRCPGRRAGRRDRPTRWPSSPRRRAG